MHDTTRLSQLIRLLGSDRDGERLAAVAAIDRSLRAAGFDWHTLADAIERGWQAEPQPKAAEPKPWQAVAMDCLCRGANRLSAAELDFLSACLKSACVTASA